jgi:PEP-CTERM motif
MKANWLLKVFVLLLVLGTADGRLWASTITFDFQSMASGLPTPGELVTPPASGTNTFTFTSGSATLATTAYVCTSYSFAGGGPTGTCATGPQGTTLSNGMQGTNLFLKNGGTSPEQGLGLSNTPDYEIGFQQYIQMNFSSLFISGLTEAQITIGSIQTGEGFVVGVSNNASFGTVVASNDGGLLRTVTFAVDSAHPLVNVSSDGSDTVGDHNVLISSVSASSVPEPSTLLLLFSGLLGLAALTRKKEQLDSPSSLQ